MPGRGPWVGCEIEGEPKMHRVAKAVSVVSTCGVIALLSPGVRADDVPISEGARAHFAAGVALLQDPKAPRYEEAYREFKAAYAASPSYKILGNLGLCAMKIERDEEAANAYETYLKEAGPELGAKEREQIQRDLLTLKSGLIHVTVSSDPAGAALADTRVPVQGEEVHNAYGSLTAPVTLGLRRGHHILSVRLPGYVDQNWEFDATDSSPPSHVFVLVKPESTQRFVRERPIPVTAYVVGGLTVALAIGGAVTGSLALSEHTKYNSDNTGYAYSAAHDERSTGLTYNYVTDSLFGVAIIGAVVTTVLVVTRPSVERPIGSVLPVRVVPSLGRNQGGLVADWVF